MKLLNPSDPFLRKIQLYDKDLDHKPLGEEMYEFMLKTGGVGLAANQVGISAEMFVTTEISDKIIVNPKWEKYSGDKAMMLEGCLSFPGWLAPVERYTDISAWWTDIEGTRKFAILDGLAAHVFQHETDHLRGILMIDRLTLKQKQTLNNYYGEIL